MNTEGINNKILDRLLHTINIDEWEDEDRVGGISELSDSYIRIRVTFKIISDWNGRRLFAVKHATAPLQMSGIIENIT